MVFRHLVALSVLFSLAACGPESESQPNARPPSTQPTNTGTGVPQEPKVVPKNNSNSCTVATTCPKYSCACRDGKFWTQAQYCLNGECQDQFATCVDACEDNGGYGDDVKGPPVNNPPPAPKKYGCELNRYSNDYSVTVRYFGSDTSETSARQKAYAACKAANWTDVFCSGVVTSCVSEDASGYKCTWSKYSDDNSQTIYYYGEGDSPTDAKLNAMGQCNAGTWKDWFCASGSFACNKT